jgi:hypothetical protein
MSQDGQQQHRGTLILVLGILGLVICPILGIIAWVMGSGDLKQMQAGRMDPEGRGLTQAGKILGIVSVVFMAIGILWFIVMGGAMFASVG